MSGTANRNLQTTIVNPRTVRVTSVATAKSRDSIAPATVFLAPLANDNPYLQRLREALGALGIQTTGRQSWWILGPLLKSRAPILHLHWLDIFFARRNGLRSLVVFVSFVFQLMMVRAVGIKVFWTAHNLRSHEQRFPLLDRMCTALVVRLSQRVFVHCQWAKQRLRSLYPGLPPERVMVTQHASYIGVYQNMVSRAASRLELGIAGEQPVFLFLGAIRPYKGVLDLIDGFLQCDQRQPATLVIAGRPHTTQLAARVRERASGKANIQLHLDFVPDDRIQVFMNAADVVVLPYRDIFTSGAALLAMSFGKAIVAPRIGCMAELLRSEGAYLYDKDDPRGLTKAISQATREQQRLPMMGLYNLQQAQALNWTEMARCTAAGYSGLLGRGAVS